ncbi:MAG: Ku protein [Nitrososphaerota archaeon]|uniref:non-homologous end joining protein Ku n=1 Tax=Candidatus Bathycorpusculum sp. TaxID=2994959 RepID=UPI00282F880C|nr:Ku protein [Candidatus Termitimicrobium sp.]MCL2430993.1 Ku protein [Candidatus Termitimicrobium sp.]MDR0493702.1 Ku protein [Nitrososphaerota archaeon]
MGSEQEDSPQTKSVNTQVSSRSIWSGSITIGLVNVPVKLYTMIYNKGVFFRFLHKTDGQPIKYVRVCVKEEKPVPWTEIVRGYEVSKNEYIIFETQELVAVRPESDKRIRISKFVDYFSVDPLYFDRTYALLPDKSIDAYSLLLSALERTNKAGAGRITLRTKEYPVLLHTYRGALVLTTLRYVYDVIDPQNFEALHKLVVPQKTELDLAIKIVSDLSGDFDIAEFQDTYKQNIQKLINKKIKGEKIIVEKPPETEAKGLMVALQETLKQLEQK